MEQREKKFDVDVPVPAGIQATIKDGVLFVKGPKGEVKRLVNDPLMDVHVESGTIRMVPKRKSQREKRSARTMEAHIKNMFKGVQDGHIYRLKICSGHFPMSVTVKGHTVEIKNFIGEKVPRTTEIYADVHVKIEGDQIIVDGIDKEKVSETAARIEQITRRPGFDPRIFRDGIYIIEKDGKSVA